MIKKNARRGLRLMMGHVRSMGLRGLDGYEISVECYITNGLPGFDVVGLPDAAVKEAREPKRPERSTIFQSCSAFWRRRGL